MADVNNEGKNLENEVQEQKKGEKKGKKGSILNGILFTTISLGVSVGTAALTSFCTSRGASKTVRELTKANNGLSLELNQTKKAYEELKSQLMEKNSIIEMLTNNVRNMNVQRVAEDAADKATDIIRDMTGNF